MIHCDDSLCSIESGSITNERVFIIDHAPGYFGVSFVKTKEIVYGYFTYQVLKHTNLTC